MNDLIVQRYNIVTVHRHGEMYDELREKPDGKFCYYKEANESHKEILAERWEPVNKLLIEALQALQLLLNSWSNGSSKDISNADRKARAVISKALGEG
ncbi:hypothetical protein DTG28_22235 [Salmonella enterica subsp. salamae]|nr:hypothetical protein [Salmonella enterica subsp. salamae]